MIFVIIKNRKCHTINHPLICDFCFTSILFFILSLIGCVYGLRKDWYSSQPLCIFRAYVLMVVLASNSYSFMIQAISQLFFAVFFKHRFLLTWRTHWILIILKWFISFLLLIEPFFIKDGFQLVEEFRICSVTINTSSVALYCIIISFVFSGSIVAIIYIIILYQVRQSTCRVTQNTNLNSIPVHNSLPLVRKHLKIMQNMLTLMNIFACGGTPYIFSV